MQKIFRKIWPLLFILIVWFIFSSPFFLNGLIPFPSKYLVSFFPPWSASYGMPLKNNAMPDVIGQIYPWKKITIETWKQGEVPLWNPYSFSGVPQAANYQSAVFSPFNILFYFFSMPIAWSWLILLQPLLAGLFMYGYLKELDLGDYPSILGSVAFMFCGFITVWMAYGTLSYAALFLPLILLAILRSFKRPVWWAPPLLSLGLVLSFFSGHFQISLYVFAVSILYLLFMVITSRKWKTGVLLLGFLAGGVLLASPQTFPAFISYQNAVRSALFNKGEVIPWSYLSTIFAPDFYGNPVTRNDWFGHYAEWASYIGVLPLMLAFFTLGFKKNKHTCFFWVVTIIGLLLATPTPLNDLLFQLKIPVLSTSAASRIIVIVSFSLSVLAAEGFTTLLDFKNRQPVKKIIIFSSCMLVILVVYWTVILLLKPLTLEKLLVAKRNSILPTMLALGGLSLIVGLNFISLKYKKAIAFIFLLITSFDSLRYASKWMPFDPEQYVYPGLPVISYLTKTVGINRLFGNFGGELYNYFGFPSIEGYDAVYPDRYGRFMTGVNTGMVGPNSRSVVLLGKKGIYAEPALELLGVKYLLHRKSDGRNVWAYPFWNFPNYQRIYQDGDYEVYENTKVLPRAFLVSSYEVVTDEQEIINKLFSPEFDRYGSIILEEKPVSDPKVGEGKAEIVSYSSNKITVKTASNVSKLLFVSDTYDPGWQVRVDGVKQKIYRADFDFRAVSLNPGEHKIDFTYYPHSFTVGLDVAIGTLACLVMITLFIKQYENRFL